MKEYSIIIPTFNEQAGITQCLKGIQNINSSLEVIVVDGGSTDQTVAVAKNLGAKVFRSEKGRGVQLNHGAENAHGEIFLFLHADTLLPPNAFQILDSFFINPQIQIGTFRLRFGSSHWFLKFSAFFSQFDTAITRFGDQCIVIRKTFFEQLGGFSPWPLLEDVDFLCRARKKTRIYSFPAHVISSARRFKQKGPIRQQIKNGQILFKYFLGACPNDLAREYQK